MNGLLHTGQCEICIQMQAALCIQTPAISQSVVGNGMCRHSGVLTKRGLGKA